MISSRSARREGAIATAALCAPLLGERSELVTRTGCTCLVVPAACQLRHICEHVRSVHCIKHAASFEEQTAGISKS